MVSSRRNTVRAPLYSILLVQWTLVAVASPEAQSDTLASPSIDRTAAVIEDQETSAIESGRRALFNSVGPSIRVDAEGPDRVSVGHESTFHFYVRNPGKTAATGLFVRIGLPDPSRASVSKTEVSAGEIQTNQAGSRENEIVWMFPKLEGASRHQLTLGMVPLKGESIDFDIEWTLLPKSQTVSIAALHPKLRIELDGPPSVLQQEQPELQFHVFNAGTAEAKNVVVRLSTEQGQSQSFSVGRLVPGDHQSVPFQLGRLRPGKTVIEAVASSRHSDDAVAAKSIEVQNVDIQLALHGPSTVQNGDRSEFSFHVVNNGTGAANDVVVRLSGNEEELQSFTVGKLGPGVGRTIPFRVLKLKSGKTSLRAVTSSEFCKDAIATKQLEVYKVGLKVALSGPSQMLQNENPEYGITISNEGNAEAKDVIVRLSSGSGQFQSFRLGHLAPGGEKSVPVRLGELKAGANTLQVVASATQSDEAVVTRNIEVHTIDLQLELIGPGHRIAGSHVIYQCRVRNPGSATAQRVEAGLTVPYGINLIEGPRNLRRDGETMVWTIGNLAPQQEHVVNFRCNLHQIGKYELKVTALDALRHSGVATANIDVQGMANIRASIESSQVVVPVGEACTYGIHLHNVGTKEAQQVQVVVRTAPEIETLHVNGAKANIRRGTVEFATIPALRPGQHIALFVRARAHQPGVKSFRAEVLSAEPNIRQAHEVSTHFYMTQQVAGPTLQRRPVHTTSETAPVRR